MQNASKAKDMELMRLETHLKANEVHTDKLNIRVKQLTAKKLADRTLIAELTGRVTALHPVELFQKSYKSMFVPKNI